MSRRAIPVAARRGVQRALARTALGPRLPALPTTVVTLTLPEPPSANRWWRRAGTHMHLSTAARDYKERVAVLTHGTPQFVDGDLSVTLHWYRSRRSGDLDKRVGIALDALQGAVFTTDAQITELVAKRFEDKANPRLEVTVRSAGHPGEETP